MGGLKNNNTMENKILNRILLILLIILVVFIVWKIVTYEEKPFNSIEFAPNHHIFNMTDVDYLDTIVHAGIQSLNIDTIIVTIRPLLNTNKLILPGDIDLKAHIIGNGIQYIIYIDVLTRGANIRILSHELIHLNQYYNKDLIVEQDVILWKGDTINMNLYSYENLPWEKDAFCNQNILKGKIEKILY